MKPDNNRQNNGQHNKPHSDGEPDIEPDIEPVHPKMGSLIAEVAARARDVLARKST